MKNYKIEISRTDYRVKTFEVSAENQDAAIDVAMQQAYDYNITLPFYWDHANRFIDDLSRRK